MKWHRIYLGLGIPLLLLGIFLPPHWYNPLPQREVLSPPPISGFWLLQLSLVLEGVALLWLAYRRWEFIPIHAVLRDSLPALPAEAPGSRAVYAWLLAGVTFAGFVLRSVSLNSDLWLDEITPIVDFRNASLWQVMISYISSNNHLLNTLLVKLGVTLFGEQEWAIRLPAVIFGIATIPAMYWVARQAMSRRASLSAALLLAVSYHHIFFSQDARAYTAYVFFSLVSTALLIRGLQQDRRRIWALYIVATVLSFASILISGFVFAAQMLVGGLALMLIKRRGESPVPMLKRLIMVFAVAGFFGFQLYAAVLPQVYVYMRAIYAEPSAGFAPFSAEFMAEIARGLSAGFGTGLFFGAIPFLTVGGIGYLGLVKRNWALTLALTAPGALQAFLLVARNLVFSPRFFILTLPLAILVVVQGIDYVCGLAANLLRRSSTFSSWSSAGLVILLSVISLTSLPRYYSVPKQAYRSSLQYVEAARQPKDMVIVIHLAESGYRYYGEQFHIREGQDYFYVRSVAALERVLSENPGRRSWLVVTFPRALHLDLPDLEARIQQDWIVAQEFPGTVGDGDITVWQQRQP